MEEVADRIIEIIAGKAALDPAQVRMDASLESLGVSSINLVEALFDIEETYDISIPLSAGADGSEGVDISTIGSIIAAIKELIDAKTV